MKNKPDQTIPDENQLEAMLVEIKPQPTARFYQKMRTAPWVEGSAPYKSRLSKPLKPTPRFIWGTVALVFLLMLLAVVFIPSVRAIARQIIFSFIFEPSNQLEVQVTLTNPDDLFNFSDPYNFPLNVEDVQQAAGFSVRQISNLPQGLTLVGGRYDDRYYSVTLLYSGNDYQIFLTQRPLGHGEDVFSIGSDAQVKQVMVGEVEAEYVAGGWKAVSTQDISPSASPTSTVNITAVWDDSLPQATLRWQSGGYAYELRSLGEGSLPESELINLANGLK